MKINTCLLIGLSAIGAFVASCFPNLPNVSKDGNIIALCLSTDGGYYQDHWDYGRDKDHNTVLYTRDLFLFNKKGEKVWRVTDLDGYVSFPSFGYNSHNKTDKLAFVYAPSEDFPRQKEEKLQDSLVVVRNIQNSLTVLDKLPTISKKHLKTKGRKSEPIIVYQSAVEPRGYVLFPEFSPSGSKVAFIETQNFPTSKNIKKISYAGDLKIVNLNLPFESESKTAIVSKSVVPQVKWLDDETIIFPRITGKIPDKFAGKFSVLGEIVKMNLVDKTKKILWKGDISRFLVNIAINENKQIAFDSTVGFTSKSLNKIFLTDCNGKIAEVASGFCFGLPMFRENKLIFFAPTYNGKRISKVKLGTLMLEDPDSKVEFLDVPASVNVTQNYKYWLSENYIFTKSSGAKSVSNFAGNNLAVLGLSGNQKETNFMQLAQKIVADTTPNKRILLRKAQQQLGFITKSGNQMAIKDSVSILDIKFFEYKPDEEGKIQTTTRQGTYIEIVQMPVEDETGKVIVPGKIRTEQNIIGSGNEVKCWDGKVAHVLADKMEKYDPADRSDMIRRGAAIKFAAELTELIRGRRLYLLQNILEPTTDEDKLFHDCSIYKTANVIWDFKPVIKKADSDDSEPQTQPKPDTEKVPVFKKLLYLLVQSKYKIPFAKNKVKIETALLGFEVGDRSADDYGLLREIRMVNEEITGSGENISRKFSYALVRLRNYQNVFSIGGNKIKIPYKIIAYDTAGMIYDRQVIPGSTRKVFEADVIRELKKYSNNEAGNLKTGINNLPTDKNRKKIFSQLKWE